MAIELRQPSHRWYSDLMATGMLLLEGRLDAAETLIERDLRRRPEGASLGGRGGAPHRSHRVALGASTARRDRGAARLRAIGVSGISTLPMRARPRVPGDRTSRGGGCACRRAHPRRRGDDAVGQLLGLRHDDACRGCCEGGQRRARGHAVRRARAVRSPGRHRRGRDRQRLDPSTTRPDGLAARAT